MKVLKDQASNNAIITDSIRHVVVLMLENRSFDHMLGDVTKIYPNLEGIPQAGPKYRNTSTKSGKSYEQNPNAYESISIDIPHEFVDVQKQLGMKGNQHMVGGL